MRGPLKREAAECPLREDGDEADRRDRRGQAEAERDDQGEAEADAVQSDRAQQHDEGRRAGQQACRDADAEKSAPVVVVMVVVVVVVLVAVLVS